MAELSRSEAILARNEQSLKTLIRSIRLSQGRFALILVRCNYSNLRQKLMERLHQMCPVAIQEITLSAPTQTLFTTVRSAVGSQQPPAVVVLGLESAIGQDPAPAVLLSTNQVRDEFRRHFQFPLVLWLNDDGLKKLIKCAPDFNSWAAPPIEFLASAEELITGLRNNADQLFTKILTAGSGRFVQDSALEIEAGSRRRFELETALNDLRQWGETLEPELEASLQFVLGRDAYAEARMEEARQSYERSLAFWQHSRYLERQGVLLFYLGLWWLKHADLHRSEQRSAWRAAQKYCQRCVAVFQRAKRPDLVAKFVNGLGEVLQYLGNWNELEALTTQALTLHELYRDWPRLAQDYGFLAEIALVRSAWMEAKLYAEKSLQILAEAEQAEPADSTYSTPEHQAAELAWARQYRQGLYRLLLARAQEQFGQLTEAETNLKIAQAETQHQYNPPLYIRILEMLRSLHFEQGQYFEAFQLRQEQRSIEQQYGFRAFVGAGQLQPNRQKLDPALPGTSLTNQEIAASGRTQDVNRLIERIGRNDFSITVIHGESGVGKSSIVNAGLAPVLRQGAINGRDVRPVVLRSYTDWKGLLGDLLHVEQEPPVQEPSSSRAPTSKATMLLKQLGQNGEQNLLTVLIFDQFEEFFFIRNTPAQRHEFVSFLSACLKIPFVKIIFSLREDYLHYLLEFERNSGLQEIDILSRQNRYPLGNFSPDDARSVIENLAQRAQFYLEPALVDELVWDLAGDLGSVRPIELQIVGAQLQAENIVTLAQYRRLGPKQKLVERSLREIVQACGPRSQFAAQQVLLSLTNANGTRPPKTREQLADELASEADQLDLILEILVGSGLIFLLPEVPTDRYQLVHDYLVPVIRRQGEAGSLTAMVELRKKESETLISSAKALFQANKQLEALLAAVKAAHQVRWLTEMRTNIPSSTLGALQQIVYETQERNRLEDHSSAVWAVSFSPNGQLLASASWDSTLKLWGMDGALICTLTGHTDRVYDVCFSPNGELLASASWDKTIKLWKLDGTLLQTLSGHGSYINSLSFSPDGELLASASWDKTIKLWKLDGSLLNSISGHADGVRCVCFSPDGQTLASASADRTVKLWNLDGRLLRTFNGHTDRVYSVSFSPDGQTLASASRDRTVKLWTLKGELLRTLDSHGGGVNSVGFSPNGQMIASASADGSVKLWSYGGSLLNSFNGHGGWVTDVSFSSSRPILASACDDASIKLWSLDGPLVQTFEEHEDSVWTVGFSPDGQLLASAGAEGTVQLWGTEGQLINTLIGHHGEIAEVSFSPDGHQLASAGADSTIKLWSTEGHLLRTLTDHYGWVHSISFSPDGELLASGGDDKTIRIWSAEGNLLQVLKGHQSWVHSVKFSPDGEFLASASADRTIKLWRLDGQLLRTLKGHQSWVHSISFSPDGELLASASADGSVKLWSVEGQLLKTFKGNSQRVLAVSFNPNGKTLASAGVDKTVRLWTLEGTLLKTLTGHNHWVTGLSFSPDGAQIASASADHSIKLWNAETLDFGGLLSRGCSHLRDYLRTHPKVSTDDRQLCN
ncbi:hypothetical protein [Leptolyngbya sp. FACHB-261]|uniref:WD40 domain-containing protein n=1 Tax=Leptolyngbya sp. FACHB-261 TaxID=2692806 RepID=UPI001684D50F|nr:hypothetical protein [Leptolyngbya sp. FACHB-261]MBD2099413.1 hypothetical protein [Leptolyngbya sp. FACHB-261]